MKTLYYIEGTNPTDEEKIDAKRNNAIGFRNALMADEVPPHGFNCIGKTPAKWRIEGHYHSIDYEPVDDHANSVPVIPAATVVTGTQITGPIAPALPIAPSLPIAPPLPNSDVKRKRV